MSACHVVLDAMSGPPLRCGTGLMMTVSRAELASLAAVPIGCCVWLARESAACLPIARASLLVSLGSSAVTWAMLNSDTLADFAAVYF